MKRLIKNIGFAMLLIAIVMAVVPAYAQGPVHPISPDSQTKPETQAAVSWDAKIYASNMGVSVEEALRQFHLQNIAGNLDAELSEKELETYAGLWIEHTPEFRVVVQFTRDGEQTLKSYLVEELADITEVRTAKMSLEELRKIQEEITSAVRDQGIGVESQTNVFENQVELFLVERALFDKAVQTGGLHVPDSVKVFTVRALGKPTTDIYGGLALSTCTSGFSVVRSSDGIHGITTAGHCSNTQSYNGSSLTYMSQMVSGSYDIQWHRAIGFTVTNEIQWWSDGSTRDITATQHRNNQAIGDYVCMYGMTSTYTCGYISSKTYCPSYVQNCSATFIRVDDTAGYSPLTADGDSGGPWFLDNTAYGTLSGSPGADLNDAIYMAVNYIGGLGVSVMTSP